MRTYMTIILLGFLGLTAVILIGLMYQTWIAARPMIGSQKQKSRPRWKIFIGILPPIKRLLSQC
jgi:hypothetical protein